MRVKARDLTTLLAAAGVSASVLLAPVAAAAPQCTNTAPRATLCQTPGHAALSTSPEQYNVYPYWGWPFLGGFSIGWR
jgi:hypothetical protein